MKGHPRLESHSDIWKPWWDIVLCCLRCLDLFCPRSRCQRCSTIYYDLFVWRLPSGRLLLLLRIFLQCWEFLKSPIFEPLWQASLRDLTRKTLFLIALASAKRISELQALSRTVAFSSSTAAVAYVPEFLAKTESALPSLPRSFDIPSLSDFVAGLPNEMLLCPVRFLSEYIVRTASVPNRPRRLFVSPRNPSQAMSKNGISFLLREVIVHSGASPTDVAAPRAHSIRGIATSSAFFRNWSLTSVLEAASWRSNTVFTSFYLKDIQYILDNVHSLGPFVAAGARLV